MVTDVGRACISRPANSKRQQRVFGQAELTVQLLGRGRGRRERHDDVDPLGALLDLVCEPTAAPDVDVVDGALVIGDDGQEPLERRRDLTVVHLGVDDDHDFVLTHAA